MVTASLSEQIAENSKPKNATDSSSVKVKRYYAPSLHAIKENIDNIQRYICPYCRHPFNIPAELQNHLLVHHKKMKRRFMCLKCLHIFASNYKLERHLPTHDKKPPRGKVNSKTIATKLTAIANGISTDNAIDLQFECYFCPEVFTLERKRSTHEKIHFNQRENATKRAISDEFDLKREKKLFE